MLRREFSLALCSLAFAPCVAQSVSPARGPLFWLATRGKARVYLLGFAEAKDSSWFTPPIQRGFQQSSQLWLEDAPPGTPVSQDPAVQRASTELIERLSHESGRTLFDALEPAVRQRTLAYIAELGIKKESVETLRPWAAYYVINSALWSHWSHTRPADDQGYVEALLGKLAKEQGKRVGYELPSREAFVRFMAGMPDRAQSQFLAWLLDYLDDQKKGLNTESFGWITGHPAKKHLRSLNRMRERMPDLYQAIQVQRNIWWARKIDELLATEETYFVGMGMLHVLGPDSIPSQLRRLGIVAPDHLRENPPYSAIA